MLSEITREVVSSEEIDDPLAISPPKLIGIDYDRGTLTLKLDRPISDRWVRAIQNMGGYSAVMGAGPENFQFTNSFSEPGVARIRADANSAQAIVDYFKQWLPIASRVLRQTLESEAAEKRRLQEAVVAERLRNEEARRRVISSIRI